MKPRRTLAEVSARGVSGHIEAVAASSGTGTSGSLAAERETPFKRASRSHDRGCEEEGGRSRGGCCSSRSSGHDGPEVQVLKESLQKARRAAQERPINAMLSQTEAFVERARKCLQAHDAARQQLVQELEEGEGRLSRLEAARTHEVAVQPAQEVRTDTATQVQQLQQMVNKLQEEKVLLSKNCMALWSGPGSGSACPRRIFPRLSRPCRR